MGNCLRRSRSAVWAAAEEEPQPRSPSSDPKTERQAAPEASTLTSRDYGNESVSESLSGSGCTEVKIKMTKKQLNELFAKVEQQGVTVEQALAQMLEAGVACEGGDDGGVGGSEMRRQQSWRPKLQSIPEAVEVLKRPAKYKIQEDWKVVLRWNVLHQLAYISVKRMPHAGYREWD